MTQETHGTSADAREVRDFIEHILRTNLTAEEQGRPKSPICIWGHHGIGKTQLVETIARENKYKFAYIAPAQFEEMGDLLGMPAIDHETGLTHFKPPAWVPREEGPGVLLIDDVNRADDRILRGIMQLLQNFELVSWRLPPKWQIVLTANPDDGNYSVTPMDPAMLTRMMHVTMRFEVKVWAAWAERSGVDPRGINFILTHPEVALGDRTTPRTIVQLFEALRSIEDLKESLPLVRMLAASCLDEVTVSSLVAFIQQNLSTLISPEQILAATAKNFERDVAGPIRRLAGEGESLRVDILATLCTRLFHYLERERLKLDKSQLENIKSFIMMDFLPNDLRYSLARGLHTSSNKELNAITREREIAMLLLKKM